MYVPTHFAPTDDDVRELLLRPGAADLVTAGPDGPEATMLPFVHDPDRACCWATSPATTTTGSAPTACPAW